MQSRVERILSFWEGGDERALGQPALRAMQRFLDALDELSEAAEALVSTPAATNAAPATGASVLLVGTDSSLGGRLRDGLGNDHRAEVASPKDALWSAAARRPDLFVGYDASALDAVRALHDIAPGLPALLVVPAAILSETIRAFASHPVVLLREPVTPDELALAIRGMLVLARECRAQSSDRTAGLDANEEPRSYAHLAGLLPRTLERTIRFDVSATVIKRTEAEPIVEIYTATNASEQTVQAVRELALSLCRDGTERSKPRGAIAAKIDPPLQSILHARLELNGRVLGAVVIGAFRANAFSSDEERVLAGVALRASAAYVRLEASLTRLRLTPRQSQVLSLIASGLSDKQIAARLGVTHRTVRTHLDRLLREHGLHSRTEAVAAWLRSQQG
jgi:DNA-binding CsgD family transcriptional regulator